MAVAVDMSIYRAQQGRSCHTITRMSPRSWPHEDGGMSRRFEHMDEIARASAHVSIPGADPLRMKAYLGGSASGIQFETGASP